MYIYNNGIKPGFGVELDFYSIDFSTYADGEKINNWDFDNFSTSIFVPVGLKNSTLFKLGVKYDYLRFKQDVIIDANVENTGEYISYLEGFLSLDFDNRDKHYFATRGNKLELKAKYVTPIDGMLTVNGSNNFYAYVKINYNFKIANKLVFKPSTFAGYSYEDKDKMYKQMYGLGGQNRTNYIEGIVPFTGLRFVEKFGIYSGVLRAHFQYNFLSDLYATAMGNMGIAEDEFKALTMYNILYGYGLKLSYNSFFGPVEISVMGSNNAKGATYFFTIGYPL
jgi:NTE family protein